MRKNINGYSLLELIVVICIIGILSSIAIISYNGWKQSTTFTQLSSDLNGVSTAMESARTFSNSYPLTIPSTFTPSNGVTLSGGSRVDGKSFCIQAVSVSYPTLIYSIDSSDSNMQVKSGACPVN
jgi:prepilin-type N-terminal cleavage/methylation domain-containing protein